MLFSSKPGHLPRWLRTGGIALLLAGVTAQQSAEAAWTLQDRVHPTQSGRVVEAALDGVPVAQLVYGTGQPKPYLHVFGEAGELLTKGESSGLYPHHRGIFIGWNSIVSSLGTHDLWHMTSGTMSVVALEKLETSPDRAAITARIEWRANAAGDNLLLTERRVLVISRPEGQRTQVDAHFRLTAARALTLDGDLQHAGIHFRAAQEVADRDGETSYLGAPVNAFAGSNLQWCRLLFPRGTRWYTSMQMNSPANPVEELSTREYGRFGYFFKKALRAQETLALTYRFVVEEVAAPANPPTPSSAQIAASRTRCESLYQEFAGFLQTDGDQDGHTTPAELLAGTNPYDSADAFQITESKLNATGQMRLQFRRQPWKTYRVWRADALTAWSEVTQPTFTSPAPGVAEWVDPGPGQPRSRFYRISVEPTPP